MLCRCARLRPARLVRPSCPAVLRCRIWTPPKPPGQGAPDDPAEAEAFVRARGYSAETARGVVRALSAPDWGGASPLAVAKRLAGAWEVGEDAGLRALAMSVERDLAQRAGKALVRFEVQPRGSAPFECEGYEGMSLKAVAEHGEGDGAATLASSLEFACSGVMACSTCHVYVDPE